MRDRGAREEHGTAHVDLEDAGKVIGGNVDEQTAEFDASVVDEDVDGGGGECSEGGLNDGIG